MIFEPNALFLCDCHSLLERMDSGCVTLAYLDPPWLTESAFVLDNATDNTPHRYEDDAYSEYLIFLEQRLQHIHRVLAENGSLYFHADPRFSANARLILDQLFGRENFRTEIVWPHQKYPWINQSPPIQHETILVYSKSGNFIYHPPKRSFTDDEIRRRYSFHDENGRFRLIDLTTPTRRSSLTYSWSGILPPMGRSWRFTKEEMERHESEGLVHYSSNGERPSLKRYFQESDEIEIGNIWDDLQLPLVHSEKLGFPSQKPLALVKRIIGMSTNEGDLVIDPFCGSGTSLAASEQMGRRWIGCEIFKEAYDLTIQRLEKELGLKPHLDYGVGSQDILVNLPVFRGGRKTLIRSIEELQRPVVYLEGKTDVAILTTAWGKLYRQRKMPFRIKDSDVHSLESSNSTGGASALRMFIASIRADSPHIAIGIFDHDREGCREYQDLPKHFSEIDEVGAKIADNKMAAAFTLPIPAGKELYANYQNLSIEFYFRDEALSQKTNEEWGLEMKFPEIETRIKRHGNPIIDTTTSAVPEMREITKGKTVFAQRIVPDLPPQEFESFRPLFEKIESVIAYLQKAKG